MSTNKYTLTLSTNWFAKNDATKQAVAKMAELLDSRVKGVKDATTEDVQRVLTAVLAYGDLEYQIILDAVPVEDRELVAACRDALVGEVLQRTTGRTGFKVKPTWLNSYECETICSHPKQRLITDYGSIITDHSYHQIPIDRFTILNYQKCGYVTVPNYNLQTEWIIEDKGSSLRWKEVPEPTEDQILYADWLFIKDKLLKDMHGSVVGYRDGSFICHSVNSTMFGLKIATTRISGRAGYNYHVKLKDTWGRRIDSWGGRLG